MNKFIVINDVDNFPIIFNLELVKYITSHSTGKCILHYGANEHKVINMDIYDLKKVLTKMERIYTI